MVWVIATASRAPVGGRLNPLEGRHEGQATHRRSRTGRDEHDPRPRFRWSEAGSSVSTQSAPNGFRTPNLLIRPAAVDPIVFIHGATFLPTPPEGEAFTPSSFAQNSGQSPAISS